ncbi:MAG: TonB-dependent receptor [Saprospirales bacterium]|nr:TonB-dependent receptor [Saprospirales bacterium]
MKNKPLLLACLLMPFFVWAQPATQTIRGRVVDKESKYPLLGVNVLLVEETGSPNGTISEDDGAYRLEDVPVGRQTLEFTYVGYEKAVVSNIVVGSGKEVILDLEMEESTLELGVVEVIGQRSGETRNDMAPVSARQFSVEETDRYAGSRGDPGRMASNFAGVQGADDSRNDIVIRGNSPQGVLWRLEGVSIPNPNHFAIPGTGGGPVTILNNKYLDNSDFFTGAFPAEFGNGVAGVFDLRMRNGNNERHEFSGQLGFLGTELMAEGPLSREKGSSYLLSYRYSTLQLFQFLGIQVGTDAIPQYQDAAFRFNFPTRNGGSLALWGVGGLSDIDILLSDQEAPDTSTFLYGSNDRDQYFASRMGVAGLTLTQPFSANTFLKATVSASNQLVDANHDIIYRHVENDLFVVDSLPPILDYEFEESKISFNAFLNQKLGRTTTLKAGINADFFRMRYEDSARAIIVTPEPELPNLLGDWRVRWKAKDGALLLQPFIQVKQKWGERLTAMAGLSSLYFGINKNSFSPLEPRLGLVYDLAQNQRLSLGYGLHSQILPGYLYYYGFETQGSDPQEHNLDLGLYKSHHLVLGYDRYVAKNLRLRLETYYQYLFDIPVDVFPSSFSIVNTGSGFSRFFPDTLTNAGTGRNFGLEATIERFFNQGYYFLFTGSVFDSKYTGSDGVLRNTTFNGRFAFNLVLAREFTFKKGSAFNIGGKLTYVGGRWYGPVDEKASADALEVIYLSQSVNTQQFRPYFRADVKASYRWNRPRVSHEFSIDFINVSSQQNILSLTYAPDHPSGNPIREEYQLGFLPIFFYKLDFSLGKK